MRALSFAAMMAVFALVAALASACTLSVGDPMDTGTQVNSDQGDGSSTSPDGGVTGTADAGTNNPNPGTQEEPPQDVLVTSTTPAIDPDLPRIPASWEPLFRQNNAEVKDGTLLILSRALTQNFVRQEPYPMAPYPGVIPGSFGLQQRSPDSSWVASGGGLLQDGQGDYEVTDSMLVPPIESYFDQHNMEHPVNQDEPFPAMSAFFLGGYWFRSTPEYTELLPMEKEIGRTSIYEVYVYDAEHDQFVFLVNYSMQINYHQRFLIGTAWWTRDDNGKLIVNFRTARNSEGYDD